MAKKIKKLEDLLDAEMLANERLAEMVAELKTRGPDIWKKGIVGVEKSEFDNMKTRLELFERIKEENKKLKEEQFDNMEEIAKRDGMCLVDIHIFDKLVEEEEENKVLKQNAKNHSDVVDYWRNENEKLKEEKGKFHKDKRITVRSCDDRAEYNRQVMYLKSNPECKFIPERKWTKKSKDQPLEIS